MFKTHLFTICEVANHLIPVLLTLALCGMLFILYRGMPIMNYISLLANANNDEGKERLARYLAGRAGGRKINANQSWKAFLPAARDLHKRHVTLRNKY